MEIFKMRDGGRERGKEEERKGGRKRESYNNSKRSLFMK